MKSSTTSTALALVMALGAGPVLAAAEWTFSDIDADGNGELSQAEFEQVSRSAFRSWDADADQRLSDEELYHGMFVSWDTNQDDRLDQQEYDIGSMAWFADNRPAAFEDLDADRDGSVSRDDFARGMSEAGAIEGSGPEGMQYQVFHAALFGLYDTGGSGQISRDDYAAKSDSKLVGGPDTVALTAAEPGTGSALTSGRTGADGTELTAGNTATDVPEGDLGVDTAHTTTSIGTQAIRPEEVIRLSDWNSDDLYVNGLSVDDMIDDAQVYGVNGDEIGSVENVVFSNDGRVLSLVAEVGGFWDLFDTHVNVPWDEVVVGAEGRISIPVTEENVEDYATWKTGYLTEGDAGAGVAVVDDDLETGPAIFRATDLIGSYSRIRDGEGKAYRNYGYVNDLVIRDGRLQAVVVNPDTGYGMTPGAYAYPYYGWGWNARRPYYDMPYRAGDVADVGALDYERFEYAE